MNKRYDATWISESPFWKCDNVNDYMYSYEDGVGGAFMYCVPIGNTIKQTVCPSGYTKGNDICKKIEVINCTQN